MKFRITVTSIWAFDNEAERILDKYPTLNEYHIEIVDGKLYVTLYGLEDLIKFTDKYGEIVISSATSEYDDNTIEIYDDYRE